MTALIANRDLLKRALEVAGRHDHEWAYSAYAMPVDAEHDCQLHRDHRPRILRVVRHHIFPVFMQEDVFGRKLTENNAPLQDRLWVCDNGHMNLHECIADLLGDAGRSFRHNYSAAELKWSREALNWYWNEKAKHAARS
jgi:hypothetical protein